MHRCRVPSLHGVENPTVAAIEGNARQYCPGPNKTWAKRFPGMFNIKDGTVETGLLNGIGLGF